jgi:hypothetical protein
LPGGTEKNYKNLSSLCHSGVAKIDHGDELKIASAWSELE